MNVINENPKEMRDLFCEEGFEKSLSLEEYDGSWRSPDHLMHMKLFESAESVMKVDWLDESFLDVIPDNYHVFNKLDIDTLQ